MSCKAINAAGERCRTTFGLSPDGYCFPHDPLRATEWAAMQRARSEKGARKRQEARETLPPGLPRAPKTLDDAVQWASWIAHSVAAGVIDARTAEAATKAVRQFQLGEEKRALERKVAAMNKAVSDLAKCPTCAAKWAAVSRTP